MFKSKKVILVMMVLLAMTLITGCFGEDLLSYKVEGTVTFDGQAANGASIKASGDHLDGDKTATTDANGKFTLTDLKGTVTITVTRHDFPSPWEATVRGVETTDLEIAVETLEIIGTEWRLSGNAIEFVSSSQAKDTWDGEEQHLNYSFNQSNNTGTIGDGGSFEITNNNRTLVLTDDKGDTFEYYIW